MIVKICSKHGELTEDQVKRGVYRNKNYKKCRQCELDRSRLYHKKMSANPEWVKEKRERDKLHWETKKDEITKRRQEPQALAKRRDTYRKNAAYYQEMCNEKQKKYREELHDSYIKKMLQAGDKTFKVNEIPQPLIEIKRAIVSLRRIVKEKTK